MKKTPTSPRCILLSSQWTTTSLECIAPGTSSTICTLTQHSSTEIGEQIEWRTSSSDGEKFISPIPTNLPRSLDQNFVRVEVPRKAVYPELALTRMDTNEKRVSYTYSDGLGRTIQSVSAEAGQAMKKERSNIKYIGTMLIVMGKHTKTPGEFRSLVTSLGSRRKRLVSHRKRLVSHRKRLVSRRNASAVAGSAW